jgi:hypothetical protein
MGTYLERKLEGYLKMLEFFKKDKKDVEELLEIIENYPTNFFISKLVYEIEDIGFTIPRKKEKLEDDIFMIKNIEDEIVENFENWEAIEDEQNI